MATTELIAHVIFESTLGRLALAQGLSDDEVMKMCMAAADDILAETT